MEKFLNRRVFDQLTTWGKDVPHFKVSHAIDGLFITQGYLEEKAHTDHDQLFALALTLTFWFWLDDRSDDNLKTDRPLDWPALLLSLGSMTHEVPWAAPESLEVSVLNKLASHMRGMTESKKDYEWWLASLGYTVRNLLIEERISRAHSKVSYADYLEIGLWTSAVPNLMATTSLLYKHDIATRREGHEVAQIERMLSIVARLENDTFGVEKERGEGTTNALLILEAITTQEKARAFVEDDKRSYERRLREAMRSLGPSDPIVKLASAMLASHRKYYEARPTRTDRGRAVANAFAD